MLKESDAYDKEDVYGEKIQPVMKELKKLCAINRMPMFATVATANSEEGTRYRSEIVLSGAEVYLTDNRIGRLMLRLNGLDLARAPEWVMRDMRKLEDYAEKAAIARRQAETAGVELKENIIGDCDRIANG